MYVFFDLNKNESYKTNDLQDLINFVNRNFDISIEWMELGAGAKVIFSDCENYSVEKAKENIKGQHLIQIIAKGTKKDIQN